MVRDAPVVEGVVLGFGVVPAPGVGAAPRAVVEGVMSMSLELQMPGLGTLHADSKAGSVRLTAITLVPVMSLNILQEREHGGNGKRTIKKYIAVVKSEKLIITNVIIMPIYIYIYIYIQSKSSNTLPIHLVQGVF